MADDKKKNQNQDEFVDNVVVKVRSSNDEDQPLLPEFEKIPAIVTKLKKKNLPKGIRLSFTFKVLSGEFKDRYAWGSVPYHIEMTDKATLYTWMCVLLGTNVVDSSVKLGDLVGKSAYIIIKNTVVPNKKRPYQNVSEIREMDDDGPVTEESKDTKVTEKPVNKKDDNDDNDDALGGLDETKKEDDKNTKDDVIDDEDLPF